MCVSCCPADLTAYDVVQGACTAGDTSAKLRCFDVAR